MPGGSLDDVGEEDNASTTRRLRSAAPPASCRTPTAVAGAEETGAAVAGAADAGTEDAGTEDAGAGKRRTGLRRRMPVPSWEAVKAALVATWRVVTVLPGTTWRAARRPRGQVVVPGLVAVVLFGSAGTAGAWLVPRHVNVADTAAEVDDGPTAGPTPSAEGAGPRKPGEPGVSAPPQPLPGANGRPSDALAGWAAGVSAKLGIPAVAVQAYGYAELVVARTTPGCRLSWTTIAAIGKVESNHGGANQARLGQDGQVLPAIRGLPLDGQGGRQKIMDTDQGTLDGDPLYDRAMGPLQFLPSTWKMNAVDADDNGVTDPHDMDDAALTAADYLCQGGRDMSTSEDWWAAILSYNDVQRYAQDIWNVANDYGTRSRT